MCNIILFLFFLLINTSYTILHSAVKIVCTAAIIPQHYAQYEARKQQYINSLLLFQKHGLSVYVIEPCQKGPTFLDQYCDNVVYTQSNIADYAYGNGNYGINEAMSLKAGLQHLGFDPEDMIIKFTGRYALQTTDFITLVHNNLDADVIIRMWDREGVAYSALFAMKMKYFPDFVDGLDIDKMAKGLSLEAALYQYVTKLKNENKKIVYWERIHDYLPMHCAAQTR